MKKHENMKKHMLPIRYLQYIVFCRTIRRFFVVISAYGQKTFYNIGQYQYNKNRYLCDTLDVQFNLISLNIKFNLVYDFQGFNACEGNAN